MADVVTEVPKDAYGHWDVDRKVAYFGYTGRKDERGFPVYEERVSEARSYQYRPRGKRVRKTTVGPPTGPAKELSAISQKVEGTSGLGRVAFPRLKRSGRTERKECLDHDLRLPHAKGSKECRILALRAPKEVHNHTRTVHCIHCGEDWGVIV